MPETTWAHVRKKVNELATQRGEWGGAPLPVHGHRLVIEPRDPNQGLSRLGFDGESGGALPEEVDPAPVNYKVRNSWFCWKHQADLCICEEADGQITKHFLPLRTQRASDIFALFEVAALAWDDNAEAVACKKLRDMISPVAWKHYRLIGMFMETSKRSGVIYIFRKLRPTIAIGRDGHGEARVLATLCLHPIGYYEATEGRRSPCGVMVPTDDVLAHLCMMRGDEHYFWRKANHHQIWRET